MIETIIEYAIIIILAFVFGIGLLVIVVIVNEELSPRFGNWIKNREYKFKLGAVVAIDTNNSFVVGTVLERRKDKCKGRVYYVRPFQCLYKNRSDIFNEYDPQQEDKLNEAW